MSIDLTQPQQLFQEAVRISVLRVEITPSPIRVYYAWKSADGSALKSGDIEITGADYQDLITAQVTAGMIGQPVAGLMVKGIKTKIKSMLGLQGTVQNGF